MRNYIGFRGCVKLVRRDGILGVVAEPTGLSLDTQHHANTL
jgi:hypothetical protein